MKRERENLLNDDFVNRALRSLPRLAPPAILSSTLRVLASREQARGIALADRLRLYFNNLMRPLALPFAGGVFSAVLVFTMWVIPMYSLASNAPGSTADVSTTLTTEASLKQIGPVASSAGEGVGGSVVVEVMVDGEGRMVDYSIISGNVAKDEALRRSIEGLLIFTEFKPATALGQPVFGRIRLSLQSSHIDVKG